MRALLDVNVLIALLDAGHVHHRLVTAWLEREIGHGWASCPLTQNGCIRIMSQTAYPGALPAGDVAKRLAEAASHPSHEFWTADISLLDRDMFHWNRILGPRQVTDVYLLALAMGHQGRFVTLDRRVAAEAVAGGIDKHLCCIAKQSC
ncbi:MAG: VapC toxin family PIN domain ribonuclease [Deltaproteobacteria bacterium]|nr:VapC toxin family PIN domain ribonuclease [Deltaproteobacteria bacterium]